MERWSLPLIAFACFSVVSGFFSPRHVLCEEAQRPNIVILVVGLASLAPPCLGSFSSDHGHWRPIIERSVTAFLRYGDLHEGFARVSCPDCHHEMFVAFSSKQRCTCPSCHQKRTLLTAIRVAEDVCGEIRGGEFRPGGPGRLLTRGSHRHHTCRITAYGSSSDTFASLTTYRVEGHRYRSWSRANQLQGELFVDDNN